MTDHPRHPAHQELLAHLLDLRFATTEQLARLMHARYSSRRSAIRQTTRHLHSLQDHAMVLRLERRVGGWQGGSSPSIWALTTAGHRIITGRGKGRQRPHLISTTFLEHLLAVGETRIRAFEAISETDDSSLTVQAEPSCWRNYLGPHGQELTLRPDLHLVVTTRQYRDSYFIEVDRATENPARVVAKCFQYVAYRRTGLEQKQASVFPAVLWVVPTERRRDQLSAYIQDAELPEGMFHVLTLPELPALIRNGPPPAITGIEDSKEGVSG